MGKINVLGFDVANLIAAGEVVDRPASVVKELVENAVDSGASEITVEIKNGGISHIRVSDNGCGMDEEDLPVAILRHATSKIKDADDLEKISTLGFRGEALAAIASVTKLKIYTRTEDSDSGSMMLCEGGEIMELCEAGCTKGTTVIADELFYNVPARRKFLKRDATETAKITDIMEKVALSIPNISVKYVCDGETRFITQGDGDLKNAVHSVYGKRIASRLVKVDRSENGVSVSGYVSEVDLSFSKRTEEIFFVNGRYIKSPLLMSALERAYTSKIPEDKFPLCVLNIAVATSAIDVNVHPTKLEVKFSNERIVSEALHYAVLSALNSSSSRPELNTGNVYSGSDGIHDSAKINRILNAFAPVVKPKEDKDVQLQINAVNEKPRSSEQSNNKYGITEHDKTEIKRYSSGNGASSILAGYDISKFKTPAADKDKAEPTSRNSGSQATPGKDYKISLASAPTETKAAVPEYRIIGEVYDCYVIVELADRILLIDKHAAHERIIFEELCERRKNKEKEVQTLLAPIEINLLEEEILSLEEFDSDIRQVGFDFSLDKNTKTLYLNAIPSEISDDTAGSAFTALLDRISEGKSTVERAEAEFFEKALYQASCKAAIKGGRYYGIDHIKWICDRILKEPGEDGKVIKTCPHGRPVAFEIKKSSIERQFLRLE